MMIANIAAVLARSAALSTGMGYFAASLARTTVRALSVCVSGLTGFGAVFFTGFASVSGAVSVCSSSSILLTWGLLYFWDWGCNKYV